MKYALLAALALQLTAWGAEPQTVHFHSLDSAKQELVAYLFEPSTEGIHPAVVLLHGRGGPYSSLANGVYSAETLSKRHKFWASYWTDRGYVALLVDSFSTRGYPAGFPKGSHAHRPPEVSEEHRPFDAYAGLRFLTNRHNVDPNHIFLQGWSNGAMTTLITMSKASPGIDETQARFKAAIAEYPGCHMDSVQGHYRAYAPILMVLGTDDDEVGYKFCQEWGARVKALGNEVKTVIEDGAMHDFDDPSDSKQDVPANHAATEDMVRRADKFFEKFRPGQPAM